VCTPLTGFFDPTLFPGFQNAIDVALDVCTPSFVTIAVFSFPTFGNNPVLQTWADPTRCGIASRLTTVQLPLGQCVPVFVSNPAPPGTNPSVVLRYWKLASVACDPPTNTQLLVLRRRILLPFSPQPWSPCPSVFPASDFFGDQIVKVGQCELNTSFCAGQGCPPFQNEMSYLTTPLAASNQFDIDVFNNNILPNSQLSFTGCGTTQTPRPPHFLHTYPNLPLSQATSSQCTVVTYLNPFLPVGSQVTQEGVRLFPATSFPTSRTAPSTPTPPDSSAAAQTGIIIGSVGISFALFACCAMGIFYWRISQMLPANSPRAIPEWGVKQLPPQQAVQPPNPLAAVTVTVPGSVN
jgi:hypothetical protein